MCDHHIDTKRRFSLENLFQCFRTLTLTQLSKPIT